MRKKSEIEVAEPEIIPGPGCNDQDSLDHDWITRAELRRVNLLFAFASAMAPGGIQTLTRRQLAALKEKCGITSVKHPED